MNTTEILIEAKHLIETPDQWCQNIGSILTVTKTAYCSFAAINVASYNLDKDYCPAAQCYALELLRKAISDVCISKWNDEPTRTHAEVLAAFDKAILLSKENSK